MAGYRRTTDDTGLATRTSSTITAGAELPELLLTAAPELPPNLFTNIYPIQNNKLSHNMPRAALAADDCVKRDDDGRYCGILSQIGQFN